MGWDEQRKDPRERKRLRLKEYDYSQPGAYFVTICTKDRANLFGEIAGEEMRLNMVGQIAGRCWKELPEHFGNIELDQFVVMPNHVHGIIMILDNPCGDVQLNIPTKDVRTDNYHSRISPRRGSLGVLVRTFKAAVTTTCRRNGHAEFAWQSGFYDHIIRNDRSLTRIREYIAHNPQRWGTDKENSAYDKNDKREGWVASHGTNHFQGATR